MSGRARAQDSRQGRESSARAPARAELGRGLGASLAVVAALQTWSGCGAGADDEAGDEATEIDDGVDDEDGEAPSEPPEIVGPLELVVNAAQREDIAVAVAQLRVDTRAELDGHSWSLSEPGPVIPPAEAGDPLRVPLGGALVVGEHELVLTHRDGDEELRSEPLVIRVEAASLGELSASLEPAVLGSGDRLLVFGSGQTLLGLLDEDAQTVELRLGDWSAPGTVQALEELTAGSPFAASVDLALVELDAGQRWLISAWMAAGGERVRARITPVEPGAPDDPDDLGQPGEALELWDLGDPEHRAALGPHELAINHGVALLDRRVVVALEARRDLEQPSPGDALLLTRWLRADASPGALEPVRGPGSRDLDLPGRARLWLDLGPREPALSIRLARAFPWLLELAGNGLPALAGEPGEAAGVTGSPVWMASADGALGSRQVFGLMIEGEQARVWALRLDRWGTPGSESLVEFPLAVELELPAPPRGAPSLSSLGGAPILLIPMGAEQPVLALRSTGAELELEELAELGCDALALAIPAADGEGDTQRLACLSAGELRLGALGVN